MHVLCNHDKPMKLQQVIREQSRKSFQGFAFPHLRFLFLLLSICGIITSRR